MQVGFQAIPQSIALEPVDLRQAVRLFAAGFTAYLSLLTVVNAHDHPVVKVFIQVLMDGVKEPSTSRHSELEDVKIQTKGYDNGDNKQCRLT